VRTAPADSESRHCSNDGAMELLGSRDVLLTIPRITETSSFFARTTSRMHRLHASLLFAWAAGAVEMAGPLYTRAPVSCWTPAPALVIRVVSWITDDRLPAKEAPFGLRVLLGVRAAAGAELSEWRFRVPAPAFCFLQAAIERHETRRKGRPDPHRMRPAQRQHTRSPSRERTAGMTQDQARSFARRSKAMA